MTLPQKGLPLYPNIITKPGIKPSWIDTPPDLAGYLTGVGVSGQRKSVAESWEQSDKLAMAEIASTININILSGMTAIERGGASSSESATVVKSNSITTVEVKGLYILSRWRDPDSSYYYSLAITQKP